MTKALDLFQAFQSGNLPKDGGYIVSTFFDVNSNYARYELVSYNAVKNLYVTEEGLSFQSDGKKIFVLVEPPSYSKKHIEPIHRDKGESIPHRFKELEVYTAHNQIKVMISKEPVPSYSSFTILKPTGINFSLVFFPGEQLANTLDWFFENSLNREAHVPKADAAKAAKVIMGVLPRMAFTF